MSSDLPEVPEETPKSVERSRSMPSLRRKRPARALKEDNSAQRRLWLIIGVATIVLALIGAGLGWYFNRVAPVTVITTTPTPTPAKWKMKLPLQVMGYSRDANKGATPTTGPDKVTTVTAPYSKDGKQQLVVLMGRPYADLKTFMESANMNVLAPVDDAMCGISGDNNLEGCAIMADNTAILVLGMGDPTRSELVEIAKAIGKEAAK